MDGLLRSAGLEAVLEGIDTLARDIIPAVNG